MNLEDTAFRFAGTLQRFEYTLCSRDRLWTVLFPDPRGTWHRLDITGYERTLYVVHAQENGGGLEIIPGRSVCPMQEFGLGGAR
jgi:hypothetical protein